MGVHGPTDRLKLIILGTGGTCRDIVDTVRDVNAAGVAPPIDCIGFLDDNASLWGSTVEGLPVIGPLSVARDIRDCRFLNGIGSPTNYTQKEHLIARAGVPVERFATLVHPTASVSRTARLGRGVVVFQHVTITSNVIVGDHVVILPNSVVSHDDEIGDFTCVAGGVKVSGGVRIGRGCYVGTGAALNGGIEVGEGALIGMGSVVLRDVPAWTVVAGNPARHLRDVARVPAPVLGR
jgi:sugar O-acyltransferase (sialic acid O-acetyltransferase NeuD family)